MPIQMLIVEDEKDLHPIITGALRPFHESEEVAWQVVSDLPSALERMRTSSTPQIIITDWNLGNKVTSEQLIRMALDQGVMRKNILLMSGNPEDAEPVANLLEIEFWLKPITREKIRSFVASCIKRLRDNELPVEDYTS